MSLLDDAGARAVEAAVRAVESQSAAEVVVAVLPTSSTYAAPRAAAAFVWTLGLALAAHVLAPALPVTALLLAQLPLGVALYWLAGVGPILRPLLGGPAAARRAHARALQLFAERGVHRTRAATGLLIFIAERERQVVLLADRGLDRLVGGSAWEAHVADLIAGIRQGRLAEALVRVVHATGAVLATHVPRGPDDDNELDDAVVRE